ncbi:uncharacterized protein yc1106_06618 [Curvularia clavata]|uniref:Uncharacterized protein n=1 Tax=Curvularia clavata TaxID=95742 RepID=A0A9Q9DV05_CURCL|nr:uncharacterized protein yc1106_06618 [Curvularia clavata]
MDNHKPPVTDFNYNNVTVRKEDEFFKGFGIDDADTKTDLKARQAAAFRKINPELCNAPIPWRISAMMFWMTQARTSIQRRKQTYKPSQSRGDKRRRKNDDNDSDEDIEITKAKRARRRINVCRQQRDRTEPSDEHN